MRKELTDKFENFYWNFQHQFPILKLIQTQSANRKHGISKLKRCLENWKCNREPYKNHVSKHISCFSQIFAQPITVTIIKYKLSVHIWSFQGEVLTGSFDRVSFLFNSI